jgi:hypothetical protein
MRNEWMLDVLADLKTFSMENGLTITGRQLDLVAALAAAEMASVQGTAHESVQQVIGDAGRFYRQAAGNSNS